MAHVEAIWQITGDADLPIIPMDEIYEDPDLQYVFLGESVVKRELFLVKDNGERELDVIIVGVPYYIEEQLSGAVFLYQKLDVIKQTIHCTQRLILYAAAIAICLTTIFAFFLSTRVTAVLRQMKLAADNMARGDFHIRVPIRTNDEIGNLAFTLNRMAERLDETIQASLP